MTNIITPLFFAVAGTLIASLFACIPGLHVYNLIALIIVLTYKLAIPPEIVVPLCSGMIVAFAMINTIPSVLLAAPDESAMFTVQPGQKYLMAGRGYEGVMITAAGSLTGVIILLFFVGPLAPFLLPHAQRVFRGHTHWIIWCVICFMIMSEWPTQGTSEWPGISRFLRSCTPLCAGLLTFFLSGLLGFILIYRSPIHAEAAFQNLMPGFVGLFTVPWLLLNIISKAEAPRQTSTAPEIHLLPLLKGSLSGALGGGFAAFFPVITGGVGGLLAGHATAQRDNRVFLAAQGTSKLVYYAGALLFLFVPGLHLTRGGGAWLIKSIYVPYRPLDYGIVLSAIAIAGCVSFLMISPLARLTIRIMEKYGLRRLSSISLVLVTAIVMITTGSGGLLVAITATGIGMIPLIFGSRRMNCLGIILLPMACGMSGLGSRVAELLGLT